VKLIDGSIKTVLVNEDQTVEAILHSICEKIGLEWNDIYRLSVEGCDERTCSSNFFFAPPGLLLTGNVAIR
jgi:hypothetical protein